MGADEEKRRRLAGYITAYSEMRIAFTIQLRCIFQQAIVFNWQILSDMVYLTICAGIRAQLLAVGLSNGEVALYKLWNVKGGEPVRIISLADWGFEPETTGSVAELQWSPDNRAIAVCLFCPGSRLAAA